MKARRGPLLATLFAGVTVGCVGPEFPGRSDGGGSQPFSLPVLAGASTRPAHIVVVSVAGLTSDRHAGEDPAMPTLAALARAGVAAEAVESVAPAASYPAHASLATGQRPAAHGITADRRLGTRGVRSARLWHASDLRAVTVWQLAVDQNRRVSALGWPSTVGAAIPLLVPDIVPTRRGETWLGVLADSATPRLLAVADAQGGAAPPADRPGPERDTILTEIACEVLGDPAPPALLLLHLSQTEAALREFGPHSHESRVAFGRADAGIARLVTCLTQSARIGASAIVVCGDNGWVDIHTELFPNGLLAREGLLVPADDGSDAVASWSAIARSNGGSAFVYAQSERDAVKARGVLVAAAARTRAFRVVSASEMLELGADPDAWFGLEAEPGFAFGNAPHLPLQRPAAIRGAGGYFPNRAEMNVGFVAWGRGVRSGIRVPRMRQADVAPTVASLLGLDLGDTDGRVLIGALTTSETVPARRPQGESRGR